MIYNHPIGNLYIYITTYIPLIVLANWVMKYIPDPTFFGGKPETTTTTTCCTSKTWIFSLKKKGALFTQRNIHGLGGIRIFRILLFPKTSKNRNTPNNFLKLIRISYLGDGFKYVAIFTPNLGEMIQFDEHIFSIGLVQPPTRKIRALLHNQHPWLCFWDFFR